MHLLVPIILTNKLVGILNVCHHELRLLVPYLGIRAVGRLGYECVYKETFMGQKENNVEKGRRTRWERQRMEQESIGKEDEGHGIDHLVFDVDGLQVEYTRLAIDDLALAI